MNLKRRMRTIQKLMAVTLGAWAFTGWLGTHAGAQQITGLDFVPRLTIQSELGITNQIQYTNRLSASTWSVLATVVVTQSPYTILDLAAPPAPQRFYRVVDPNRPPAPAGMVWVPAGTFVMGSPTNEVERVYDEYQHTVTVSGFYMDKYLVTQAKYLAVMASNPSWFNGDRSSPGYTNNYGIDLNRPVEQVSWYDATNYCYRLNVSEGRLGSGWEYRLPTESEWEYACRAGTTTPFHYGPNLLSGMANFLGMYEYIGGVGTRYNASGSGISGPPDPVGIYQPNGYGLYDMHGNVSEWCWDWYGEYPYPPVIVVNPGGPATGQYRVVRGGLWYYSATHCRSATRNYNWPGALDYDYGFRPVLAPAHP